MEWPDIAIHAVDARIGNCWSEKAVGCPKVTASRKRGGLRGAAGRGGRRWGRGQWYPTPMEDQGRPKLTEQGRQW